MLSLVGVDNGRYVKGKHIAVMSMREEKRVCGGGGGDGGGGDGDDGGDVEFVSIEEWVSVDKISL